MNNGQIVNESNKKNLNEKPKMKITKKMLDVYTDELISSKGYVFRKSIEKFLEEDKYDASYFSKSACDHFRKFTKSR